MTAANKTWKKYSKGVQLLVVLLCIPVLVALPGNILAQDTDLDRFIVVFNDTVRDSQGLAETLASTFNIDLERVYTRVLKGFSARLSYRHRQALGKHPGVRYIAPDRTFSIPLPPAEGIIPNISLPEQVIPSGVDRVDADLNPNTGGTIGVAVLDTGIDLDHPDLNVIGGIGFVGNTTGQDDNWMPLQGVWGHGTHVAGVIGALDNAYGVVGVAPQVSLVAVKVCSWRGKCPRSAIIAGLDWVAQWAPTYNIQVVNMSLAGSGEDDGNCGLDNNDPEHEAICTLVNDHDVTVVVGAGNASQDSAGFVPAAYDEVITVSAIDDADDTFASFSNYGADVDIAAPGVGILSTALQPAFLGQYSELSGTSFSAPHVAGGAALYIRSFYYTNFRLPTPAEVKAGLIDAAEAAPSGGWPGDPDDISEPLLDAEAL